ncbi:hypothetical protein SY86_06800 [Erwinia tracheiphila]|uniref:Uncharacterized protein n=1 Tax=Erwinia tracheiphila TaxID=65700 RepID=A0A0M2K8C8_9GAMM|nr:hypothetical protein ETR_03909 [Erwinia tracheiphila PSU-1]KKF35199.1 hypothetical protein SY86_06800 [Erwinia tracheiphila]
MIKKHSLQVIQSSRYHHFIIFIHPELLVRIDFVAGDLSGFFLPVLNLKNLIVFFLLGTRYKKSEYIFYI